MQMKENGVGFDFCAFTDYDNSAEVRLYEIGSYVCEGGYSYGPIIRSRGIIHYVLSGKGILKIGNKIHRIHENQIFFIPSGVSAYYEADRDDPWVYKWIHIGGTEFLALLTEIGLGEHSPVLDVSSPGSKPGGFGALIDDIFENYEREYYCIGKIYEILDFLRKEYGHAREASAESQQLQYVLTLIKYIQLKFSEQITMENIAGVCGLNRSYLSRLFHDATGYTIKGYLQIYRMQTAQKMLRESDFSISYIGNAVGYNDIFTFSKAFKKHTGCTPSCYREKGSAALTE
jgi:AraC-like DNA-binding protein